jgi:hypothetical protein
MGRASSGQESEFTRFNAARNQLITLIKDVPTAVLWRALPKLLLYQRRAYTTARLNHYRTVLFKAYLSFVLALPMTLWKRFRVARMRKISPREFRDLLRTDYPFPTRFRGLAGRKGES